MFHGVSSIATGVAAATLLASIVLLTPLSAMSAPPGGSALTSLPAEQPIVGAPADEAPETPQAPETERGSRRGECACDCPTRSKDLKSLWPRPKLAEIRPMFDSNDEVAALEALQVALSEVGDGSTYVWHRTTGRLSGTVRPTSSFKNRVGDICRHVVLLLSAGTFTRKTEGVACRRQDGIWSLEG